MVSGGGMIKTKDGMIWKNAVRNKDDFFPGKSWQLCSEQNICTDWKVNC
ncbi:MAG: hypothetical protein IPJ09_21095 [Saprospiraceae bacterium]|nr:hypothetical protein [Saprospiraceae bacterium]